MGGRSRPFLALVATVFLTSGCRTLVSQEPESPGAAPAGPPLRGSLDYEGDPGYLPQTLVAAPAEATRPAATFRLDYQVAYQHSSNAQALNPLVLFGGRFIGTDVTARARLEVLAEEQILKSYERSCVVRLRRSLWVWEQVSTSDLRKRALSCVRDLLDADLRRDRQQLAALLQQPAP